MSICQECFQNPIPQLPNENPIGCNFTFHQSRCNLDCSYIYSHFGDLPSILAPPPQALSNTEFLLGGSVDISCSLKKSGNTGVTIYRLQPPRLGHFLFMMQLGICAWEPFFSILLPQSPFVSGWIKPIFTCFSLASSHSMDRNLIVLFKRSYTYISYLVCLK